jgi:predicted O-methyltransferase YrrM
MVTLLKNLTKSMVDGTIVRAANYISLRVRASHRNVVEVVIDKALADSAEYADSRMAEALYFRSKEDLWDFALSKIDRAGMIAEFGVFKGHSINYLARRLGSNTVIYGFDSFEGLRDDWTGHILRKGHFSLDGRLPRVTANVRLIKGWFDQTIPAFLHKNSETFSFIHIDSSTYDAARIVLALVGERLRPGTVIVFDEYFGFRGWRLGEWKAWGEFVESASCQYEYLGFSKEQAAIKIKALGCSGVGQKADPLA